MRCFLNSEDFLGTQDQLNICFIWQKYAVEARECTYYLGCNFCPRWLNTRGHFLKMFTHLTFVKNNKYTYLGLVYMLLSSLAVIRLLGSLKIQSIFFNSFNQNKQNIKSLIRLYFYLFVVYRV